ncbi:alpha/beta fold hydrolase [Nocardia otitidiscaviarum]|uniref:alpha/beta fold hydrolase n=1 Tax=Nocardia otitidiscaviarum TaxID=1823 RepID=UPI0018959CDE|nr:alpha/beta fold hydrolase [Nocardia otitidiscaviarum]MBF6131543.1 alpha/beta fold hydrolase [Nocardia otitidiscaviarum]
MRVFGGWTRVLAAITMSAGALLSVPGAPAQAATAGTPIAAAAQPPGWRGMANGYSVDYWTTRSNGEPVRASGALIVPEGVPPAGGWPIMAYDHGTSGLGPGCGGQSAGSRFSRPKEDAVLQYFVNKGFAVVAPDFLGLGRFDTGPHPYLELRTEATATIDLVRAAREIRSDLSRSWAVTGFSQGGHAALGTAHLQSALLPDLDFRGTIAVDPASDIEKVAPFVGPYVPAAPGQLGTAVNGFVVSMFAGLRDTRPELDLNSYLTPRGRQVLDDASGLCFDGIMKVVDGISVGEMLARPLADERFRAAVTDYMAVPTSGYDAPILLLLNATDKVVPSPLHAALAAQFTANGVDYSTVVGMGEHTELNPQMWAAIEGFVARVLSTPTLP